MNNKDLLVAAVLGIASAGCQAAMPSGDVKLDASSIPKPLSAGDCTNATCQIFIEVTQQEGKCVPKADPEITRLTYKGVEVYWVIKPGNWKFAAAKGIAFKTSGHPFTGSHRVSDSMWYWKGTGRPGGYYKYSINLIDDKGEKCVLDPGVVPDW
jgi:hypothetical protein